MKEWVIVKNQIPNTAEPYEVAQVHGYAIYGIRHLQVGEMTFGRFDNPNKAITECLRLNQIAEIMKS